MLRAALFLLLLVFSGAIGAGNSLPALMDGPYHDEFLQTLQHPKPSSSPLNADRQIDRLFDKATAHQAQGRVSAAFDELEQALSLSESIADKRRRGLVLGGLSDGYLLLRQADKAQELARRSLQLARAEGEPAAQATALNHLGNALMGVQRHDAALRAYREGIELADEALPTSLAVQLMTNSAHALLTLGREPEAVPLIESALHRARIIPVDQSKAVNLIALGYLAQRIAESHAEEKNRLLAYAYVAYSEALELAERSNDARLLSSSSGHLGELYLLAERYADADTLFQRAKFFAHEAAAPELLARWYWKSGRALLAQNQTEAAQRAYRSAIAYLEEIQYALVYGFRGDPLSFRDNIGAVYLELADILLAQAESAPDEQRRLWKLRELRAVMEEFKTVELENHFKDGCVAAQRTRVKQVNPESRLSRRVAVLYTIVFPTRVVLLVSFSDGGMEVAQSSVDRELLRETAKRFLRHLARSGNARRLLKHSQALHQWLIEPIKEHLIAQDIDTLILVPDEVLLSIPFAALHDGQGFLIERYALVVTPGLMLTMPMQEQRPVTRVLLNGLSLAVEDFSPLPHVRNELRMLAEILDNDRLLDADFRKSSVRRRIEGARYSAVLFATHGRFLSDPDQSFLLTYDDKIHLNELDRLLRRQQAPLDLLVLSACETAEGDERAALGLAGVAVRAGVASVVASLWSINDESTAQLVSDFFSNLKSPGTSKAKALQLAQQKMLTHGRFHHPFHWASFILVGSWN